MRIGMTSTAVAGALAASVLLTPPIPVRADEPPVTECDRLAADPDDLQRAAGIEGTWDVGDGEPARAVSACETARQRYPDVARFQYQYARAVYTWSRDCALAIPALEVAAAAGHAESIAMAADCFRFGRRVPKDPAAARVLEDHAAKLGSLTARARIAIAMAWGTEGYRKDKAAAVRTLFDLVDQGSIVATMRLETEYEHGYFWLEADPDCALALLDRAAERGYPPALYRRAERYLRDWNLAPDNLRKAYEMMARAAAAHHPDAVKELPNVAAMLRAAEAKLRLPHGRTAQTAHPPPVRHSRRVCGGRMELEE